MATRCSYMQCGVACCSFRLRVCTKVQQRLHLLPCHDTSSAAIYCAATTHGGFARTASVEPRAAAANSALSPWAFSASGLAPWLSNKAMVSLWLPNAASMSGVLPDRLHLASPLALASNITSATAVCPQRHATHLCACGNSAQGHQREDTTVTTCQLTCREAQALRANSQRWVSSFVCLVDARASLERVSDNPSAAIASCKVNGIHLTQAPVWASHAAVSTGTHGASC